MSALYDGGPTMAEVREAIRKRAKDADIERALWDAYLTGIHHAQRVADGNHLRREAEKAKAGM